MGQTTYANDHDEALAGQVVRAFRGGRQRGRYECSEDLTYGRILELHTDGKLRAPQTASAVGKIVGVLGYSEVAPPGGYKAGALMPPVLRGGQVWLPYVGTAPSPEKTVNISSSSTTATDRGKVTGSATSTTAGSEVYNIEGLVCIKVNTTLGLALCEINLPA